MRGVAIGRLSRGYVCSLLGTYSDLKSYSTFEEALAEVEVSFTWVSSYNFQLQRPVKHNDSSATHMLCCIPTKISQLSLQKETSVYQAYSQVTLALSFTLSLSPFLSHMKICKYLNVCKG